MKKGPFKVSLSIDGLEVSDEVLDNHLAIIEVYVCHDGNNAHNLPIKLDTIKAAQETLKNKPLVAGFNGFDFEGHEVDEVLIGYFPESSHMHYVEKNGKTYLVAEAIMPKLYAKWAYDIFQRDKNKSVSMEIEVLDFEELYPDDPDNDETEIKKFIFNAVTVLGADHMPACEGASATMVKFSKESAKKIYDKHLTSQSIKKKYFEKEMSVETDDTTYMEKDIKINNNKESAIDSESWSNPGKSLYEPLLNSDNKRSLLNEAYLIVESGYEDAPSEHLKYPHHTIKGSELVLNVKGVVAAFQRASQEGIVSGKVKEHLLRHYRELGLSTENFEINEEGGKSMPEEEKKMEDEKVEVEKEEKMETFDSEKEDEKSDRDDAKEEAKEKEEDERSEIDDYKEKEKGEEMEATSEEESEEKDLNEKDARIKELEAENCALHEKLCKYEEEDKARAVEAALCKVVDVMSQDEISNLREDAKNYSLEEMSAFENKVKACAFEKMTEAKDEDKTSYTKMAITDNAEKKANGLW